jgi:hypothetical protein
MNLIRYGESGGRRGGALIDCDKKGASGLEKQEKEQRVEE